jgi:hypothetical protein
VFPLRRSIILCVLGGLALFGWVRWRTLASHAQQRKTVAPTINKTPVNIVNRTFDPANPPADMPPLPAGENAECVSDFQSTASVRGQTQRLDATHATLTVSQIKMTLELNITIWVPADVTQHVIEHEEGHRQISEYYYQTADKIAERIAATYMGKQGDIAGTNLNDESNRWLEQMAADITTEYSEELNPNPTQLLFDDITDHSRNNVIAKDAVDHALKNIVIESTSPATNPPN